MNRKMVAAIALVCSIAGACGGDDAGVAAPTPTPARSPSDEPEFFSGGECPATPYPGLPEGSGCVTSVADDGARLFVYALLDGKSKPRTWRVRLVEGSREIDQRLREANVWSYPRALGATDVEGDGRREWWIKVADYGSHGAAWGGLDVYLVRRGALRPITFEGRPLTVDFGGISRLGQGAVCRDGDLVLLRVWARDRQNTRWWVSERTLELDGGRARFAGRRQRTIVVDGYTDPDLVRNYRVECHGTTLTPFD